MTPSSWKKAMITVIYKKGEVTNPENYRPICGFQQLYKLFSTAPTCRPGRIQKSIPNNGSPYDVQTHIPEKQRVGERHVGGSDRLQEGICLKTTCGNLEIPQKPFDQ